VTIRAYFSIFSFFKKILHKTFVLKVLLVQLFEQWNKSLFEIDFDHLLTRLWKKIKSISLYFWRSEAQSAARKILLHTPEKLLIKNPESGLHPVKAFM
jgi:hypothetical protein